MSVQFRPEGPAKGLTDEHVFSGRGTSGMLLETETECAWCKGTMRPSAVCNPDMACVASGAFDVEAETYEGPTGFKYSNEDRQTKLSEIAKGGGIDATVAAPKVGIPVGPVTLTEIQLSVTKAQDHNKTQTLPEVTGSDVLDHTKSLRCTIRATMSTAGTASVTPEADTSVSSSLWDVNARASASIRHDLRLDAQVSSSWPYARRPSLKVRLHADDAETHGTVTVEGKATSVSSPLEDATGTRWWTKTPPKDDAPGPDAGE